MIEMKNKLLNQKKKFANSKSISTFEKSIMKNLALNNNWWWTSQLRK